MEQVKAAGLVWGLVSALVSAWVLPRGAASVREWVLALAWGLVLGWRGYGCSALAIAAAARRIRGPSIL